MKTQTLTRKKTIKLGNHKPKLNGTDLSFRNVREFERTKHVHRLHPYLGKFIPQLVEHFLKKHFKTGQIILDPYVGSGTTLVEANTVGTHSIGIEISEFNCLISKVKTQNYDLELLKREILDILQKIKKFSKQLPKEHHIQLSYFEQSILTTDSEYLKKWLAPKALQEILYYRSQISEYQYQDVLKIILSRATRSARQIPHYDLARPQKPIREKYYCIKHKRMCEPINEVLKFLNRYSYDTIRRIKEYTDIKTKARVKIVQGDSRNIKLPSDILGKIDGIFTSPPYIGMIDYHDQHNYAYELFGFPKYEEREIGPMKKGKSFEAKKQYQKDIIAVFKNILPYLKKDAKIFFVINDRDLLYPEIADKSDLKIIEVFQRPVLMRTERDNARYSESIYYFKKK